MTPRRRLRRGHRVMATDDPVAPGIRRSRASWVTATGIFLMVLALVLIVRVLDDRTQLSEDEVADVREQSDQLAEFLEQRSAQRDAERAEVQAQLDEQRRVLCTAISTLAGSARGRAFDVLEQAANDLQCAALPPAPAPSMTATTGPTSEPSSGDDPTASRGAGPVPGPGTSAGAPAPDLDPAPDPAPGPAPSPGPDDPPSEQPDDEPGLLDPVTEPVCDLLGICL